MNTHKLFKIVIKLKITKCKNWKRKETIPGRVARRRE
jgi:hypothetical protein